VNKTGAKVRTEGREGDRLTGDGGEHIIHPTGGVALPERSDPREVRFYLASCFSIYIVWLFVFDSVGRTSAQLPSHDLTLSVDRSIPFVPEFVWIYLLGYIYPLLPLLAVKDWHRFNTSVLAVMLGNMVAYTAYFLLPVSFPVPAMTAGLSAKVLGFHNWLDFHPGANKIPSFHVASVWISYLACRRQRLRRWGDGAVFAGAALVTLSTLFVKKHLVLDVVAGVLLALAAWFAARWLYPALSGRAKQPIEGFKRMIRRAGPALFAYLVVLFVFVGLRTGRVPPWFSSVVGLLRF
jgi:membrane-associated phospholipid phosphatase